MLFVHILVYLDALALIDVVSFKEFVSLADMKLILISLMFSMIAFSQELYFFKMAEEEKLPELRIKENTLFMKVSMRIEKVKAPEVSIIQAFHQGYGKGRDYQIQIDLKNRPAKDWRPMLKIGEDVLMLGISVSFPDDPRIRSSVSIESDNPKKIIEWVDALQKFYQLDDERVHIDLDPRKEE